MPFIHPFCYKFCWQKRLVSNYSSSTCKILYAVTLQVFTIQQLINSKNSFCFTTGHNGQFGEGQLLLIASIFIVLSRTMVASCWFFPLVHYAPLCQLVKKKALLLVTSPFSTIYSQYAGSLVARKWNLPTIQTNLELRNSNRIIRALGCIQMISLLLHLHLSV